MTQCTTPTSFLETIAIGWFHRAYDMPIEVVEDERHLKLLRDATETTLEYVKEYVDSKHCEPFGVITTITAIIYLCQ